MALVLMIEVLNQSCCFFVCVTETETTSLIFLSHCLKFIIAGLSTLLSLVLDTF